MKLYRCGWCGSACNEYGSMLNEFNPADYENPDNDVERVQGDCCQHEQDANRERMRVTRDMAIDTGDSSLERELI